jgi:hypothetical protein
MKFPTAWITALGTMKTREYWNTPNTVEFFAFVVKAVIIIPGLLFGFQIWWLFILALVSSAMLVWSSTVKTLPTLIWFNLVWIVLALSAIAKHFLEM